MSTLHIPDDVLRRLGGTEREALTEIACRLYETRTLPFDEAARFAETTLEVLAEACAARRIPVYWVTEEDLASDLRTLRMMGV
jgi:predicted HTH domain antitoxin